ncbi:MAG TPA: response regulator [Luteolibacter sp.]|jgi:FixJ family two-component response regulator
MKTSGQFDPSVHLIDDDASIRGALQRLLSLEGFRVRTYASATDFLMEKEGGLRGCLLMDIRMPDGLSGLELHKVLQRERVSLPVIFLTGHGSISMCAQAMRDGAFDFLTKPIVKNSLLAAVSAALGKERDDWEEEMRLLELEARGRSLTPCESKVFQRVARGEANKQIADAVGCSERTVKAHRANVMTKMGADSLAALVRFCQDLEKRGWVS